MLPWLTAWARLVVDDATAADVAERAVVRAASGRKALGPMELRIAARAEAARLLAREVAAVPEVVAPKVLVPEVAAPDASPSPASADVTAAFAPPGAAGASAEQAPSPHSHPEPPLHADPRENTATGRLAIALEALAPYERLACVSYFVDGSSTDAVAALLGVSRERAIGILDGAAPVLARAVGESELPDFSVATDEVEVVAR